MRRCSILIASVMMVVAAIFLSGQALATNHAQAEIKALQERLIAAIRVKDYDAIMACYIPGEKLFVFDVVPRELAQFVLRGSAAGDIPVLTPSLQL